MKDFHVPYPNSCYSNNYMRCNYDMPKLRLARAYIVKQPYTGMLPLDKALKVGTVFPNIYNEFPSLLDLYDKMKAVKEEK